MIAIIDYEAGNLKSVEKAFAYLGHETCVTDDPAAILAASHVVLPGVGAFADAMEKLKARGLDTVIRELSDRGTPLLGICLGMQLMYAHSEEGDCAGLGILPGRVVRFRESHGLKVPQIGWNKLEFRRPSRLFAGLKEAPYVYFVHSYYVAAEDPADVTATTRYGVTPHVAVEHGNLFLVQFHPEKSGDAGLAMLDQFAKC